MRDAVALENASMDIVEVGYASMDPAQATVNIGKSKKRPLVFRVHVRVKYARVLVALLEIQWQLIHLINNLNRKEQCKSFLHCPANTFVPSQPKVCIHFQTIIDCK